MNKKEILIKIAKLIFLGGVKDNDEMRSLFSLASKEAGANDEEISEAKKSRWFKFFLK